MRGAGIEPAEREREEAVGSARARALCARAARGSLEPPPGGRGGGGAGECVRLARAREGLSSPYPRSDLSPALGVSSALPGLPRRLAPHFPPCHLPFRSFTWPPPSPAGTQGYCFRVRVTSRVRRSRLGAGPGRAAFAMRRPRVGDRPAGGPGPAHPSLHDPLPQGIARPAALALQASPLSQQMFPKSQPTQHPPERFAERRAQGV